MEPTFFMSSILEDLTSYSLHRGYWKAETSSVCDCTCKIVDYVDSHRLIMHVEARADLWACKLCPPRSINCMVHLYTDTLGRNIFNSKFFPQYEIIVLIGTSVSWFLPHKWKLMDCVCGWCSPHCVFHIGKVQIVRKHNQWQQK